MAVRAFTDHPGELLADIKSKFSEGKIKSWKLDEDGDLTLTLESFANQAWMRPKISSDRLLFNIIGRDGGLMSTQLYAVYHGRLVQMLLAHFDTQIKTASATAMPTTGDHIPD